MDEIVNIRVKIPADFSEELDRYLLDQKIKTGKRKSKSELIINLALLGWMEYQKPESE